MMTEHAYSRCFEDGSAEMCDRVARMFAQWAIHPNPVVADELWAFVEKVRRCSLDIRIP